MLEEQGIIGPADGAKPREVYGDRAISASVKMIPGGGLDESEDGSVEPEEAEDGWKKI
jgi:hypothetical protein